jgi:hypothetical protein
MAGGYTALEAEKTAMRIATELVTRGRYDCMQQFKGDISKTIQFGNVHALVFDGYHS